MVSLSQNTNKYPRYYLEQKYIGIMLVPVFARFLVLERRNLVGAAMHFKSGKSYENTLDIAQNHKMLMFILLTLGLYYGFLCLKMILDDYMPNKIGTMAKRLIALLSLMGIKLFIWLYFIQ